MNRRKLWWWEPRWSFVGRVKKEWAVLFRPRSVLRVFAATALAVAAVMSVTLHYVPGLQFEWFAVPLMCLGLLYSYLLLMWALHLILPPIVEIRSNGIALNHGQSTLLLKYDAIEGITIHQQLPGRRVLRITCRGREHERGIAGTVSLDDLTRRLRDRVAADVRVITTAPSPASCPR